MFSKLHGILLKTYPFLGDGKILKVLTQEEGLLSFLAKGINQKKWTLLTRPFCIAEWVVAKKKGDLHLLKEGTLLDPLLEIQNDFDTLLIASQIAKDLIQTQLPGKKEPHLYSLTQAYLKHLGKTKNLLSLHASFRLKLLHLEGLLSLESFAQEDLHSVEALLFLKRFSDIHPLHLDERTKKRVDDLFENSFR